MNVRLGGLIELHKGVPTESQLSSLGAGRKFVFFPSERESVAEYPILFR